MVYSTLDTRLDPRNRAELGALDSVVTYLEVASSVLASRLVEYSSHVPHLHLPLRSEQLCVGA